MSEDNNIINFPISREINRRHVFNKAKDKLGIKPEQVTYEKEKVSNPVLESRLEEMRTGLSEGSPEAKIISMGAFKEHRDMKKMGEKNA
jgi:hypothetical protein